MDIYSVIVILIIFINGLLFLIVFPLYLDSNSYRRRKKVVKYVNKNIRCRFGHKLPNLSSVRCSRCGELIETIIKSIEFDVNQDIKDN